MTKPNVVRLQARNLYCSTVVYIVYSFEEPSERAACVVKRAAASNSAGRSLLLVDARASAVRSRRHALDADYGNLL
eukprot:5229135-Pleurochrysis_carterae.AAC.1